MSNIQDFSDEYDKIAKDRSKFGEIAKSKVAEYKSKELAKAEKDGINPDYKKNAEDFINMLNSELDGQIIKDIVPRFDELYKTVGEEEVSLEIDKETLSSVVDNFEKYAKEKYTNKSKMVEIYELLTASQSN